MHKDSKTNLRMTKNQKTEISFLHAGGGCVQNEYGAYLLIFRNGKWDLPKGTQENGETLSATALREVQEECGLSSLTLGRFIARTIHSYWNVDIIDYETENKSKEPVLKKLIFKKTHWYHIFTPGQPQPTPQTEEGIEQCIWCSLDQAKQYLKESYPSLRWLINRL